jgi:hypothetical protein
MAGIVANFLDLSALAGHFTYGFFEQCPEYRKNIAA